MPSPADYRLRVSAGTDYNTATHVPVRVNHAEPLHLAGPGGDVWLNVRIKNYRGRGDAGDAEANDGEADAKTSAYFDTPLHKKNDDTYGISLWFVPRGRKGGSDTDTDTDTSDRGIAGGDLQWGNDFDRPIRTILPPGFGTALRIVKWWIDPGLDGDPYADKPFLYGPALSSFNRVHVALGGETMSGEISGDEHCESERSENERSEEEEKEKEKENERGEDKKEERPTDPPTADFGLWFDEGGDAAGQAWRASVGCPGDAAMSTAEDDAVGKQRMKWALGPEAKARWTWQYGRGYGLDFYNGYLDFEELALRLPGFHMPLLRFWDGQQNLRYVLRHRQTGEVYVVIVFELVKVASEGGDEGEGEDGDEDDDDDDAFDESKVLEEARRKLSAVGVDGPKNTDGYTISSDDVD